MDGFQYRGGVLHAEQVSLEKIASDIGTPAYVYSTAAMLHQVDVFRAAFGPRRIGIFFAVKANGNLAVLTTLRQAGVGADVVSQGELRKSLAAGIDPKDIIYSGVGKTDDDLAFAVAQNIFQINVETEDELMRLDAVARQQGRRMPVALRVNPAVGAGGHAKITTGLDAAKFGVSFSDAERLYIAASAMQGVQPVGLAVHIGSQIHDLAPLREAFTRLRGLAASLRTQGHDVPRLDLGGGLGVSGNGISGADGGPALIKAYADMVVEVMHGFDVDLSFEPGRLIMANAGVLLARVITTNRRAQKTFLIVDAAMNDLARPALYDARHDIVAVRHGEASATYDVVGPVCETADSFGADFKLPRLEPGDLVAVLSAGAYGAAMASAYNQRPLVAEAMVKGDVLAVVRPRQSYEALLAADTMPDWL